MSNNEARWWKSPHWYWHMPFIELGAYLNAYDPHPFVIWWESTDHE